MVLSAAFVLLAAYLSLCFVSYVIVTLAVESAPLRSLFLAISFLTPIVFCMTVIYAVLGKAKPSYSPVSQDLADVENEIESERIARFGGTRLDPSFSEAMRLAYLK